MKKYIKSNFETIYGNTFSRAARHLNSEMCGFITAYKSENSIATNKLNNKKLESEIHKSGLTFYKVFGGFDEEVRDEDGNVEQVPVEEATFLIFNNRFTPEDFKDLMIRWCKQFNQQSVLITEPKMSNVNPKRCVNVIGYYYNQAGEVEMSFEHVTMDNVEQYFTRISNHSIVLSSMTVHDTPFELYSTLNGRMLASKTYKAMYWDQYPHV